MPSRDDNRSLPTERRWIPPSTIRRDALTPEARNDLIFRKVRGILNKLTPEKFVKLSNDLLSIQLNSDVILKGVIFLIFDKALDEPKYSSMYAQLCKRLSEEAPNFETDGKNSTFKRLLLNICKDEFEKRSSASEKLENQDELEPEDEERRQVAKRKMLGNIKFIGELGKLNIVSDNILHSCILQLLKPRKRTMSQAEDIECLCQIMRTCGAILDTEKGAHLMTQYFSRMCSRAESNNLPLRIRFMLRDVIELRNNRWTPRKATSTEGPMPINQVKNDNEDGPRGGGGGGGGGGYHHSRRGDDMYKRMNRVNLDFEPMISGIPLTATSSFGVPSSMAFGTNNFAPSTGLGVGFGRHNGRNQPPFYQSQNKHQNNYQGKHGQRGDNSGQSFNNNGNKEQFQQRFNKSKILIGNPEEVSLRPPVNSMTFKQANMNPNLPLNIDMFPNRVAESPLMRVSTIKSTPPILVKDPPPAIVIKQGPVDKRGKGRDGKDKGPTKEEIMEKVSNLVDELASNNNVEDAVTAFKELKIPDRFLRHAVFKVYSSCVERGDEERDLAAKLVAQLRKENAVSTQQFTEGWKELIASIPEKEATVSLVMSHVAFLTARAIVDGLIQLAELVAVTENGQHYPLFLLTLQKLHKSQGKAELSKMFNDSKVNLMSQLPEAEKTKDKLGEILEDRDLTFLYPLLRIQGEMWRQLELDPNPTSFYKWIKEKLDPSHHSDPGFINALMSVLVKYITQETTFPPNSDPTQVVDKALQEKEFALLEKYQRLLHSFLNTIDAQVTAVHSLQVYCLSLNFPKGMLLRWFAALYELAIIEEEALTKWKEDVNDTYPGKGKALFQVNSWLTWLADQPSDEEDDDEEKADN